MKTSKSLINVPQFCPFGPGQGFALHKIRWAEKSTLSAWYEHDGELIDVELRTTVRGVIQSRHVKTGSPAWIEAARYASHYLVSLEPAIPETVPA